MWDRVRMRLDLHEQLALLEHGDDALAGLETVEAVEGENGLEVVVLTHAFQEGLVAGERKLSLGAEDIDERQLVAAADLEIVEVVRRGDLHGARALLRVGIFVGDDRDAAADERQDRESGRQGPCSARRPDERQRPRRRAWSRDAWSPR